MTYEETQAALKSDPRILALKDFIFDVYPKRDYPFHTSLTNCSLSTTPEEDFVGEAFEAFIPDVEYPNWLCELPGLIYWVCETHVTKQSQLNAARKFLRDAVDDLLVTNFREGDMGQIIEDDE